jgi:hypothetical protein
MYNYDLEKSIMQYYFTSVSELLNYLEKTDFSPSFNKRISDIGDWEFSHTDSFNEALELCKKGGNIKERLKLEQIVNDLANKVKIVYERPRRYNSFAGFAPNVPLFLEGNPLNMYNIHKEKRKKIDVYFEAESNARTSVDEIYEKGKLTLSIIKILEAYGYNVNLIFFSALVSDKQKLIVKIMIKEEKQSLEIFNTYFPMCHPAFSRRIIFRLLEKTKDIDITWQHHYGFVCDNYLSRKLLGASSNDIFIRTSEEAREELDKLINIDNKKLIKRKSENI